MTELAEEWKQMLEGYDGVREVAKIGNKVIFARWGEVCPNVVLTDERIKHIIEGHRQDYETFGDLIEPIIESPDFILEDERNELTALFIRTISQSHVNVVVRLELREADAEHLQSSIITMYRLGDKTLKRLLKKCVVLYKASSL